MNQPNAPTITVRIALRRTQRGWEGTILAPLATKDGPRALRVATTKGSRAAALGRAAALAKAAASNPVLAAMLPPQAQLAFKATSALAKAAKAGQLASVAAKYAGPAMKRLSKLFG